MVPPPQCRTPAPAATSDSADAYRVEASRHIYECFPGRVYMGLLPPLIFGVVTLELEVDDKGQLGAVSVVRKPAAEIVEPWLVALVRRAAPFPVPARVPGGAVRFVETFFIDRSGLFQAQSLVEGQKGGPSVEASTPLSATP
ncbi:MAG: hypothetical protein JNL85_11350 [Rubrivivax sp.]|nr:hypothetical protein [Rubrivivax sp.]